MTYTATVRPAPGGGTVSFTDNSAVIPGCSAAQVSGTTATCAITAGAAGAHNIVASFSGFSVSAGSTSSVLTEVVTPTSCLFLVGCNLHGLNLTNANLARATVTGVNFNKVTWSNTTCPDGTNSSADGGTCIRHL